MEPTAQPEPSAAFSPDDENLEFKPWVKIAAWAAVGAACLSLAYYAFYKWGYESGRRDAMAIAEKSMADVLQVQLADDESLIKMAQHREAFFGGISRPELRREAMGMLLSTLIERDLLTEAEDMLAEVMPPATPANSVWAQRMLKAAHWLSMHGRWEKASLYLQALSAPESSHVVDVAELAGMWAELALATNLPQDDICRELEALASRAVAENAELGMELYVCLGNLHRMGGNQQKAHAYYSKAVQTMTQAGVQPTEAAALSYGVALSEIGDREKAVEYLQRGLQCADRMAGLADCRVVALRHLAMLSMEAGYPAEAMHYLYRAEGEATGIIAPENSFWLYLADQRAWTLLAMQEYEKSLAEFRHVLDMAPPQNKDMRVQPLEGVVRCCLALGRTEEAISAATECVSLCKIAFPADKERLGRVLLLLGQAHDQARQLQLAIGDYESAAATLPERHADRATALESLAHALMQARRWADAAQTWQALLELIPESEDRYRDRIISRIDACRKSASEALQPISDKSTSQEEHDTRHSSRRH